MRQSSAHSRSQIFLTMALLGLLILFAVTQEREEVSRAFDLTSAAPDGLLAFRLWLDELGYVTEEANGSSFVLPPPSALLFVPPTNISYTTEEGEALHRWVSDGGTAILVGPRPRDDELISRFGVRPGEVTPFFFRARQRQPLFPTVGAIEADGAFAALDLSEATAAIPLFVNGDGQVTVAAQRVGDGTVWHLSTHHSFVNEQLRDQAQATLALAILHNIAPGSTIRFDTFHLWGAATEDATAIRSLQEWLYYTPWGWALLFAVGISAFFLLLQGRRLGPPLPAQVTVRRREAAEYVIAMANLARRARHRAVVADHHSRRFKRALGRRAQIDARLSNAEFIQQFSRAEAALGTAADQPRSDAVQAALRKLEEATTDGELVDAVDTVNQLLTRKAK